MFVCANNVGILLPIHIPDNDNNNTTTPPSNESVMPGCNTYISACDLGQNHHIRVVVVVVYVFLYGFASVAYIKREAQTCPEAAVHSRLAMALLQQQHEHMGEILLFSKIQVWQMAVCIWVYLCECVCLCLCWRVFVLVQHVCRRTTCCSLLRLFVCCAFILTTAIKRR